MNLVCMIFFLSFFLPARWKGEIWPYSISRKYRTRLEPNWHWFGRSCKVPGCLWRQARLPPICRDTLWHPGGRRNAGWGEVSECKLVCPLLIQQQHQQVEVKVSDAGLFFSSSVQPLVGLYPTTWPALTTASSRHKKTWRQCKHMLRYTAHAHLKVWLF